MNRRSLLAGIAAAALTLPLPAKAMMHGTIRPVISMAGLGVSTFSTIGSLSAGSPTLPVADASGIAINDHVVIEIGGESGAGAPGTVGVGGTWPDLSYATVAAMNADTLKPNGQYAWVVANNNVYQSFSGVWSQNTSFYTKIVIPRSLAAKVIGKSGNTLTLDKNAVVATTNANVYFDNAPIFNVMGANGSGTPDFRDIVWPAGKFYLSAACIANGHNFWRFVGAGKTLGTQLAFPKGISDLGVIWFEQCVAPIVTGIAIEGNTKSSGYMIAWLNGDQTAAKYNFGIFLHSCAQPQALQTKSTDCFQGVSCSFCSSPTVSGHDAIITEGVFLEAWQIQGSDCSGGLIANCTVNAASWVGGFEWFRSTNCGFSNITGVNAIMAMNTCNNWTISNANMTINGANYDSRQTFASNGNFLDINSNIGSAGVSAGGKISGITLTQNGLANPGVTNDTLFGILIEVDNINVTVDGATVTLPNYTSPSTNHGAVGLVSDAANTTVKNYTCHGTTDTGLWANLMFRGANSCYQNITVDSRLGGIPC